MFESLRLAENRVRARGRGQHDEGGTRGIYAGRRRRDTTSSRCSDSSAVNTDTDSHPNRVPEYANASCMFCEIIFSNDRPGEPWIQCQSCDLWAHTPVQVRKVPIIFVIFAVRFQLCNTFNVTPRGPHIHHLISKCQI